MTDFEMQGELFLRDPFVGSCEKKENVHPVEDRGQKIPGLCDLEK